jgi:hypothetical protein
MIKQSLGQLYIPLVSTVYVRMMNQSLGQQFIPLGVYCLGKDDQTIT